MKAAQPGTRRAIICLTDGTVNLPTEFLRKHYGHGVPPGPIYTEEEAMKALLVSGAFLNAVIERSSMTYEQDFMRLANPATPVLDKKFAPGNVHNYAETSGGLVVTASRKEIEQKLAATLDAMRSRYTVGYRPSRDAAPGTFCRITVRLTAEAAKRAGNPAIRAKIGYYR